MVFVGHLAGDFDVGDIFKIGTAEFLNGFDHGHAVPRRRQIDFFIDIGQLHRAVQHVGQFRDHVFRNVDDIFQITVSLVQFDRRKFRIMTGIDAFITEAAVHFKNAFQAADEEAFEVEFRSDAQEDIHIEGIVMGLERTGRSTAGNGMEHRRFDFKEVAVIEVLTNAFDDFRTLDEGIRDFRIDDEVEVALTIARFLIRKAMEFFRQRTE